MNKPTIAIDIDDVLFPNSHRLIQAYNAQFGTDIKDAATMNGKKLKGTLEVIEEATQADRDTIINQVEAALIAPEFHSIDPIEQSVAILRQLHENYRLIAVSARPSVMEAQTIVWLQHHFPDLFDAVFILGTRWGHGIHVDKTDIFKQQEVSFVIDDLLSNVLASSGAGMQGILFGEYPWNTAEDLPEGIVRCKDWRAVQEYFDARG